MNRKAIIPLVVGLGIGLLAVKFAIDTIRKAQASNESSKTVTVVRAKLDIAAYEQIQKEMVETVETADNMFVPANERMGKVEAAIGRVTSKPIPRNTPVLMSMLAPEGTRAGMVGRIPPGYRAVSVKIDEVSSAGYQIQPGDWVDVIVVMDIDAGTRGNKKETIAEVILQHVQVAAIGQGTSSDSETAGAKVKPAKSATLLVPEDEAPKLHLAGTRGKLTLAMRGEDDKTQNTPAVAYGSEIMTSLKTPDPIPQVAVATPTRPAVRRPQTAPEPEPHGVLVFHGTTTNQPPSIERITFESAQSSKIVAMAQGGPTRAAGMFSGAKDRDRSRPTPANAEAKETAESGENDGLEEYKPDAGD